MPPHTVLRVSSYAGQADALKDNCLSFGMPAPRLEGVDAIEEDLSATESSWALYKEYSEELKVSAKLATFCVTVGILRSRMSKTTSNLISGGRVSCCSVNLTPHNDVCQINIIVVNCRGQTFIRTAFGETRQAAGYPIVKRTSE